MTKVEQLREQLNAHEKIWVVNGTYKVRWTPDESGLAPAAAYEADRLIAEYHKAISDSIKG